MEQKSTSINRMKGIANTGISLQEMMGRGFLAEAVNVDLDDTGKIKSREGSQDVYTTTEGTLHSLWSSPNICIFREGVHLKRLNTINMSATKLRSGLSPAILPMAYLDIAGTIYYSDGLNTGVVVNGVSRSWGLDIPSPPSASLTYGSLVAGTYQISLVFVRNDGQLSGANPPSIIQVGTDEQGIMLNNIPVSPDPTVEYVEVYISNPSGEGVYPHGKVINGGTSYAITYNQNTAGLPLATLNLTQPTAGDMLEYYNGRVYIVAGNIIYYSEPYAYELFHPQNYITMAAEVTLLAAVRDGLWVGTSKEANAFTGNESPFKVAISLDCGAIKFSQIKVPGNLILPDLTDQLVMWASPKGIFVGGNNGFNLHRTPHFKLPGTPRGRAIYRSDRGMNQYLLSLPESGPNTEVTAPLQTELKVILPSMGTV